MLHRVLLEIAEKLGHLLTALNELNCQIPVAPPVVEPPETGERLYNRKEAAAYLLVHPRSITRYRKSGRLPFIHDRDNHIRYRKEDLNACYFWKWGRHP